MGPGGAGPLAHPAGVVLAGPRCDAGRWSRRFAGREPAGDRADQPGVDREAVAGGRVLDAGLELLGEAQGDPRGPALLEVRPDGVGGPVSGPGASASPGPRDRAARARTGDDETEVAAAQADVDRARAPAGW